MQKKVDAVVSAVELFVTEYGTPIQVRSSSDIHGRFVFIDGKLGYQSDASTGRATLDPRRYITV
jgi:hypothetical protein